jgi:hypothetical protein
MNENASPNADGLRFTRTVAVLTAVVLLGSLAAAYQVGVRAKRAPSFTVGGEFANPDDFPSPGVDGRGYPYGNVLESTTTTTAGDPAATTVAPTGAPATPAPGATTAPPTTPPTGVVAGPDAALTTPTRPATGTYAYALDGTEGATGFGSRSYPARGTDVVHADKTVRGDELVHDLKLSDQHEEREVIRYSPTGIAFSFEGGSITFGPGTQTSQAAYDPLMVQIPFPLTAGATAKGSSAAKAGGSTARVEDWTTKVVGQEVLTVLGQARTTWVIDIQRTTKPGGAEQVNRFRRYWYDPTLGVWVKWTERFHASRDLLVDFNYDTTYTATLAAFTPA